MFHVCVQKFDRMDKKFLDEELKRAWDRRTLDVYMDNWTSECSSAIEFITLTRKTLGSSWVYVKKEITASYSF